MKKTVAELFFSLVSIFLIAQALRGFVYEPIYNFIQSQSVRQSELLYGDIVLGGGASLAPNDLPLPGLVWVFGILMGLGLTFFFWVYNLIVFDDGGFKKIYLLIFVINIFCWAYLFPEIFVEQFVGRLNNTLINLLKISIF